VTEIRELRDDDLDFLREMLYAALAWRPGVELPPKEFVLEHPQVVIFHRGWGREGDVALVGEEDGRRVGVVWLRSFTDAEHGEGFVDEQTPELAIAVVDGGRGRGVGARLMEAMHERARRDGLARISLSVDADNPAKRLYERLGYVDYEPGDDLGRMVLDLRGGEEGRRRRTRSGTRRPPPALPRGRPRPASCPTRPCGWRR
jgi:GNAT superfamily N-acetyltransferase